MISLSPFAVPGAKRTGFARLIALVFAVLLCSGVVDAQQPAVGRKKVPRLTTDDLVRLKTEQPAEESAEGKPGGRVKIAAASEGREMWRVEVIDTGIGMAEDQVPLIFEEFRQVNITNPHHGGGTGLGLPISRKLVELLGGKLSVASAPQKGSTFSVTWPLDVRGYVPDALLSET